MHVCTRGHADYIGIMRAHAAYISERLTRCFWTTVFWAFLTSDCREEVWSAVLFQGSDGRNCSFRHMFGRPGRKPVGQVLGVRNSRQSLLSRIRLRDAAASPAKGESGWFVSRSGRQRNPWSVRHTDLWEAWKSRIATNGVPRGPLRAVSVCAQKRPERTASCGRRRLGLGRGRGRSDRASGAPGPCS
jgi:hypothetical protein